MKLTLLTLFVEALMTLTAIADDRHFATPAEIAIRQAFLKEHLLARPPLSFLYNDRPARDLLPTWNPRTESRPLDQGRTRHTVTWLDPATELEVRLTIVDYADYPAVEWTACFTNTGHNATPILADVRGIDLALPAPANTATTLRTIRGDDNTANAYAPVVTALDANGTTLAPVGGRPSNAAFPYFNLDHGTAGLIVAVGWPGQWSARLARDQDTLHITAGQQTTRLKLEPGEQIRTPLNVVLFWGAGEAGQGDWLHGQNLWRRWMVAHNLPRPHGKLPGAFTAACMGVRQSVTTEKTAIDAYLKAGVRFDYWWMDAGWYEGPEWWDAKGVGTWTADPERFPQGIREVADCVHGRDMKLVLWFEPERVQRGSYLWENHPDWLLPWPDKESFRLLNLGHPDARRWITDHVDRFITEQGVDLYRQDHNVDPLGAWRKNDAPDRQGLTENLYVQGYLAYWDELLRRHPGMLIDSCASGGRRNDLETLRRSVPLLRSDFQAPQHPPHPNMDSGNQNHTRGLAQWIPYYGSGVDSRDTYSARSHLCPAMGLGTDPTQPDLVDRLRKRLADYRQVADLFYGDFYPLTAYSPDDDVWAAWQFVRPEKDDGMIQAFRRGHSPYEAATFPLRGLRPDATYLVTDIDTRTTTEHRGAALLETGLPLTIPARRTAVLLTFKAKDP